MGVQPSWTDQGVAMLPQVIDEGLPLGFWVLEAERAAWEPLIPTCPVYTQPSPPPPHTIDR